MEDLDNITDEYDKEFISLMLTIEKRSEILNKYDKLRIKNWCKKLCQVTNNVEWKKNRNLHAICILDSVLNEHFEYPYNKFPPEGSVPILNKALVKSQLSKKFFIEASKIQNEEQNESNNYNDNTSNLNNDIKNVINPLTSPGEVVTVFTSPYLSAGAPALGEAKGLIQFLKIIIFYGYIPLFLLCPGIIFKFH